MAPSYAFTSDFVELPVPILDHEALMESCALETSRPGNILPVDPDALVIHVQHDHRLLAAEDITEAWNQEYSGSNTHSEQMESLEYLVSIETTPRLSDYHMGFFEGYRSIY
jgi:hypothetical protein